MEIREYKKKQTSTMDPLKKDEIVKKMRKDFEKPVKGMFEFTDAQGGWFDFAWRFFPGENPKTYHFTHGEITEAPLGIVRHLNNTMRKVRTFASQQSGKHGEKVQYGPMEKFSRVKFIRMDDIEHPVFGA